MPDTQITELAGRHYLISQLLAGNVEVSLPIRNKGINLITYLDRTGQGQGFLACPLQLKANQQARFGLHRKYAQFQNLLMVYAWNVSGPNPELYALTYAEAEALPYAPTRLGTKDRCRLPSHLRVSFFQGSTTMDWSTYDDIESDPEKLGGTPVFKGTRVPLDAIVNNYDSCIEDGFTSEEASYAVHSLFPSVARNRIQAIMAERNAREYELQA